MAKQYRINVIIGTGLVNGAHEADYELPENWNDLTHDQRQEVLDECAMEVLSDNIDAGAVVMDQDDNILDVMEVIID